jgi:hypothetical protein
VKKIKLGVISIKEPWDGLDLGNLIDPRGFLQIYQVTGNRSIDY